MNAAQIEKLCREIRVERIKTLCVVRSLRRYRLGLRPLRFADIKFPNTTMLPAQAYKVVAPGVRELDFSPGSPDVERALKLVSRKVKRGRGITRGNLSIVQELERRRRR